VVLTVFRRASNDRKPIASMMPLDLLKRPGFRKYEVTGYTKKT
jgi:hypothetical protein